MTILKLPFSITFLLWTSFRFRKGYKYSYIKHNDWSLEEYDFSVFKRYRSPKV